MCRIQRTLDILQAEDILRLSTRLREKMFLIFSTSDDTVIQMPIPTSSSESLRISGINQRPRDYVRELRNHRPNNEYDQGPNEVFPRLSTVITGPRHMFPKFTMLRRKKSVSYIDESLAALAAAANSGGTGEVGHDCESLGSQRLRQMQHDSTIENLDIQALAEVVEKTFPGLGYAEIFRKNEISGSQMLELEKDDLRAIGISKLGHILTLLDLRFQNFSNKLSIRKEYEGIVQKDSRYLRIAGWKLICKVEKEEKEGGEGEVRKKFFLVWPKEPSKLKEYYYKSRPLLLYDLHRDFASDGKNNYFIEGAYRDESQKNSDILRLTRLMQEEGTRKNNKRTRGNSLSVAFPPKLVVKVIPKSKVFLHLDIEVTEINLQMEKFSIACELNIFWKDPDIFAEKRAIPIMDDDKDTDVRCFPRCPIALTRKGEDRLPLSFNRLFANGLGRSLVITHREEDFYSQVGVVHGRYKLSIRYCSQEATVTYDLDGGVIQFIARVQRYQNFYFLNMVLPAFIITMIGAGAFLFDVDSERNLEARLTLVIRLLLTIVAFKLWISSVLPIISYTTCSLTTYIFSPFAAVLFLLVAAVAANRINQDAAARGLDILCAIVFVVFWGGLNLLYVIAAATGFAFKSWEEVEADNNREKLYYKSVVTLHKHEPKKSRSLANAAARRFESPSHRRDEEVKGNTDAIWKDGDPVVELKHSTDDKKIHDYPNGNISGKKEVSFGVSPSESLTGERPAATMCPRGHRQTAADFVEAADITTVAGDKCSGNGGNSGDHSEHAMAGEQSSSRPSAVTVRLSNLSSV
eukprot:jgi/Bigna1/86014/estExt_fgenesh1_pg.C_70258